MEAFSHVLTAYTSQEGFTFRPKCQELGINHLIFAEDLFITSGADHVSLSLVKAAIEEFGNLSGLKPNLSKSNMFLAGIDLDCKEELSQLMGMEI